MNKLDLISFFQMSYKRIDFTSKSWSRKMLMGLLSSAARTREKTITQITLIWVSAVVSLIEHNVFQLFNTRLHHGLQYLWSQQNHHQNHWSLHHQIHCHLHLPHQNQSSRDSATDAKNKIIYGRTPKTERANTTTLNAIVIHINYHFTQETKVKMSYLADIWDSIKLFIWTQGCSIFSSFTIALQVTQG